MMPIILDELNEDHPLRNKPLIEINAWYSMHGQAYREVKPSFGITKVTFNQLGEVWRKYHTWKAETNEHP